MSFEWPMLLWSLLLVPLALAGYVLLGRRRMRYAVRFTNVDLLANVVAKSPGWRRHVPPALLLLALTALLVGLARPQRTMAVPREQATVMLTMDTSRSMIATDVAPNRHDAAQAAARTFVDRLPEKFRVGVVSFSTQAQVIAPPTDDRALVHQALESLQPQGGTALGDAIDRSLDPARQGAEGGEGGESGESGATPPGGGAGEAERSDVPVVVLLLSDGKNTQGATEPLDAAEKAKELGVPVYTVALGTEGGEVTVTDENGMEQRIPVPPDVETLRQVAETTGGEFFDAPDSEALEAVYENLASRVGFEQEEQEVTYAFLGAGTILLLAAGTLSALWFNRIP